MLESSFFMPLEADSFGKSISSRSPESEALLREISERNKEEQSRSYLGRLIVGTSEFIHGSRSSLDRMNGLIERDQLAEMLGDSRARSEIQRDMQDALKSDRDSRKSADSLAVYGSGFVKALGMFFPGKAGYAMSAISGAADSAHPSDSGLRQSADLLMGAAKGTVLKYGADRIGSTEWNPALKAAALSTGSRFAEASLDSRSYFDFATGKLSLSGGLQKGFETVTDLRQLSADLAGFGGGYLISRRLGLGPQFAAANPVLAQTMTGAGFGFSSGFFSDMQMRSKLGEGFSLGSSLKSGFLQMSLDGAAAAVGGARMRQLQTTANLSEQSDKSGIRLSKGADSLPESSPEIAAAPRFAGLPSKRTGNAGGLREFLTKEDASGLIEQLRAPSTGTGSVLTVREILAPGERSSGLGPEQKLLVQHLEPGSKLSAEQIFRADLIASCDPQLLNSLGFGGALARHIFPEAGSSPVMLQVPGSKHIRFALPDALKSAGFDKEAALALGHEKIPLDSSHPGGLSQKTEADSGLSVSQWFLRLGPKDRMSDLHDVALLAEAMRHYKLPIKRYLGGGNETVAFEMQDGRVLRVTEKPFRPEWGRRTIDVDGKEIGFDAQIIGQRMQVRMGDKIVNYYEQVRGITPVSREDLSYFEHLIQKDGRYVFWDNDGGSWGQSQLGYVPLRKFGDGSFTAIPLADRRLGGSKLGLALIDYDSVRIAGTEPRNFDNRSWSFGRPSWLANYDLE